MVLAVGQWLAPLLRGTKVRVRARESGAKAAEGGIHLLDKAHEGEVLEVALGDFKEALVDEEEIAPFVAQQSFYHHVVPPWHGKVGGEIHAWAVVSRVREG